MVAEKRTDNHLSLEVPHLPFFREAEVCLVLELLHPRPRASDGDNAVHVTAARWHSHRGAQVSGGMRGHVAGARWHLGSRKTWEENGGEGCSVRPFVTILWSLNSL